MQRGSGNRASANPCSRTPACVWVSVSGSEVTTATSASERSQGALYLPLCSKGPQCPPNKASQMIHPADSGRGCVCVRVWGSGWTGLTQAAQPDVGGCPGLGRTHSHSGHSWARRKGSGTRSGPSRVECWIVSPRGAGGHDGGPQAAVAGGRVPGPGGWRCAPTWKQSCHSLSRGALPGPESHQRHLSTDYFLLIIF